MTRKKDSPMQHPDRKSGSPSATAAPASGGTAAAPTPAISIVAATAALSAACRELAAMLEHAKATFTEIAMIGETADALAKAGAELQQAADSFRADFLRTAEQIKALDDTPPPKADK